MIDRVGQVWQVAESGYIGLVWHSKRSSTVDYTWHQVLVLDAGNDKDYAAGTIMAWSENKHGKYEVSQRMKRIA